VKSRNRPKKNKKEREELAKKVQMDKAMTAVKVLRAAAATPTLCYCTHDIID